MKRKLSLLLAGSLLLLSACGETTPAESGGAVTAFYESGIDESYVGSWYDVNSERATMDILPAEKGGCQVVIDWAVDASERLEWRMTARYDAGADALRYEDGVKKRQVYGDDGELESEKTVWEDGEGTLRLDGDHIRWSDEAETLDRDCRFEQYEVRPYSEFDPSGVYHEAEDSNSTLLILPPDEAGEYDVTLDVVGLGTIGGMGRYTSNIFSFTGDAPNGTPFTAVVTKDGKDVLVTVTQSQWGNLPVGAIYSFIRRLPDLTPEDFTTLFTKYLGAYAGDDRDAGEKEAAAAHALARFAADHYLAYRDFGVVHAVAYRGYMALEPQVMNRFDHNLYEGLYQLVEAAYEDFDPVRDRFEAVGMDTDMEYLVNSYDGYDNWEALRNHLFTIGVESVQ